MSDEPRIPTWVIRVAIGVALVGLAAWSAWQRWLLLDVSPFPLGVDGYYYPIQLRALLEEGALHYPAAPLTFWFMTPFAAATDPITGAKLGAAIGGALVAVPAYGVGAHLAKQRSAGLVAAAVATLSASSAYLTIEFVKQGFGLTVGLAAIWCVLRAIEIPSRRRLGVAIAGVAAAALTHKTAVAIVLVLVVPAAFEEARARGFLRGRRLLYSLIATVVIAIVAIVLGLVMPERFVSPSDLGLVRELLTSDARWDAPALVRPGLELSFNHEAATGGVVAIASAIALVLGKAKRRRGERIIAWGFVVLGLVLALPWLDVTSTQGLGFRLRVAAYVPLAVSAAVVAGALAAWFSGWQRDAVLVALAVVLVVRTRTSPSEGRIIPHPALVSAVVAASTRIPADTTVIVPERHIMFMVAWYTRADVRLRPERIAHARRVRMLPLHFTQLGSPLEQALDTARADGRVAEPPIALHSRHRNGLVLVTERTWDWLLAAVPERARAYWGRWPTI